MGTLFTSEKPFRPPPLRSLVLLPPVPRLNFIIFGSSPPVVWFVALDIFVVEDYVCALFLELLLLLDNFQEEKGRNSNFPPISVVIIIKR